MRGQGWHFLDMGRRIERCLTSISLLRSLLVPVAGENDQPVLLETTLLTTEALMTYRRRYQRNTRLEDALDLLLLESANPRSLLFQLQQLEAHLQALPAADDGSHLTRAQRLLLEASSQLRLADLGALAQVPEGQYLRSDLDQLLARIQQLVSRIAETIEQQFFVHTEGPQPMTPSELTPKP